MIKRSFNDISKTSLQNGDMYNDGCCIIVQMLLLGLTGQDYKTNFIFSSEFRTQQSKDNDRKCLSISFSRRMHLFPQ